MKVIRSNIKYILICPLVIAFFIAAPVEASDPVKENKEEVQETKLFYKTPQSVKQKPKHNAEVPKLVRNVSANFSTSSNAVYTQRPKYILYCNLIFYE